MLLQLLSLVGLSLSLPVDDAKQDDKVKQEIAKLQGTWTIATLEVEGNKLPEQLLKGAKIEVKGDSFVSTMPGAVYKGTIKIDATASPRTLDLIFTDGPEKGNTSLAIYEVDGDNWKMCLTLTGKVRPREFATKAGSGLALETLKRQK